MTQRKFLSLILTLSFFSLCLNFNVQAQTNQDSNFNPQSLWRPSFYPHNGNEFRSADGAPGPKYWQNSADYTINCTLDTIHNRLSGTVIITYTNNSPDSLRYLWLQMDQNSGKKDSRSDFTMPPDFHFIVDSQYTNGFELSSVATERNNKTTTSEYVVTDSRMQIRLKEPLKANGGQIKIKINYAFKVSKFGTRMGWVDSKDGRIYDIAQWYPRMAVYDNVEGWNNLPYLGIGEFYLEYGDFDYSITLPANMIVAGSGKLINGNEVLTQKEQEQLQKAYKSDTTVFIRTAEEAQGPDDSSLKGTKTWHFVCKQSRDVAWTASRAFIWDAARINLPEGKTALAQTVYSAESDWGRSTEYIKASLEFYSRKLGFSYPYPVATGVPASWGGGMEYPGIVFDAQNLKGKMLWVVTIHEFGHTWFPMIVGSNERKYMWMDEGLNTFINSECTRWFNDGEFYEKTDQQSEAQGLFSDDIAPIMTVPDAFKRTDLRPAAYDKPALGLQLLRTVILDSTRFDYAFNTYIKNWAYKHPTPWDFFHSMENASGEDLDWFWREWFFSKDKLDQAIDTISYVHGDPTQGAWITLENKGKMALPAIVQVSEQNGKDSTFKLPFEIWQRGKFYTIAYPSTSKLKSVTLDPNHVLPDINPENNSWIEGLNKPIPKGLTGKNVVENYLDAIGGLKKIKKMKDYAMTSTGEAGGMKINFKTLYKSPDNFKFAVTLPTMNNAVAQEILINKEGVHMTSRGKEQDVPDSLREAFGENIYPIPEALYLKKGYKMELAGYALANGQKTYKVIISDGSGSETINYYDIKSGLKVKSSVEGESSKAISTFSNYKKVNGIQFPFSTTQENYQGTIKMEVEDLKVNSGLKDSDFQ